MKQNPGILPGLSFDRFGDRERAIASKLSRLWFISFARPAHFKGSEYYFIFGKPTDQLIRDFNITREVLILFTPYKLFQPRVLDFVDKTIEEYANRLDKLCIVLISPDQEVQKKIHDICIQDRESKIIVPYCYSDFLAEGNALVNTISDRLRSFLYERDLYAFDSPLRSENYFYGRSQVVQALYGKYQSGENSCLFGLRRIGKTSALFALKRFLEMRLEPCIYFDCSEPAFHRRRWTEALFFIVDSAYRKLQMQGFGIHGESQYDEKNASRWFEQDLTAIQKHAGGKRILLVFDEIENITHGLSPSSHWKADVDYILFWQSIRSIYQKNLDLFAFCVAGVNPRVIEASVMGASDNPIYRMMTPNYLGLFNEEDVTDMVESIGKYMGLRYESEIYTYLTDDYGGHPFLIRQACSQIHKSGHRVRPTMITKYAYKQDRAARNAYLHDYVELIISVLKDKYATEYELLRYLAAGDQDTFAQFATAELVSHLFGYGLIAEDHGKYHFRISVVEEYLKTKLASTLPPITREEKWAEVSKLRNKCERDLRRAIKLVARMKYSDERAKEKFIEGISKPNQKAKLAAIPFDKLFDEEVYLEDLRRFILNEWSSFQQIFSSNKQKFDLNMNFINKCRVDAHAKDISDSDMTDIRISIKWIQECLDKFFA